MRFDPRECLRLRPAVRLRGEIERREVHFERLHLVIGHILRRVVAGVFPPLLESVQKQPLYQP